MKFWRIFFSPKNFPHKSYKISFYILVLGETAFSRHIKRYRSSFIFLLCTEVRARIQMRKVPLAKCQEMDQNKFLLCVNAFFMKEKLEEIKKTFHWVSKLFTSKMSVPMKSSSNRKLVSKQIQTFSVNFDSMAKFKYQHLPIRQNVFVNSISCAVAAHSFILKKQTKVFHLFFIKVFFSHEQLKWNV